MSEPTAAHARDLGDYVALARRRWTWIVGCVVAGIAVSYVYLGVAQETYESTAKVLVESTGTTESTTVGARTNDAINLDTEAQLVKSEPVSARAAELLRILSVTRDAVQPGDGDGASQHHGHGHFVHRFHG